MFKLRNWFFPRNTFTLDMLTAMRIGKSKSTFEIWKDTDGGRDTPNTSIAKVINTLRRLERLEYITSYRLQKLQLSSVGTSTVRMYAISPKGVALLKEMRPNLTKFNEAEHQLNKVRKSPV